MKELCIHMDMEITGSDLKGEKLFNFTDSAEVEAQKVENKVTIDAGLPYIPTIWESEGEGGRPLFDIMARGWGLIGEGCLLGHWHLFKETR